MTFCKYDVLGSDIYRQILVNLSSLINTVEIMKQTLFRHQKCLIISAAAAASNKTKSATIILQTNVNNKS